MNAALAIPISLACWFGFAHRKGAQAWLAAMEELASAIMLSQAKLQEKTVTQRRALCKSIGVRHCDMKNAEMPESSNCQMKRGALGKG